MTRSIALVLPVEATGHGTAAVLAPGLASFGGASLGVVDNGLWGSMRTFTELWRDEVARRGGAGVEVVPFDHLAPDFTDQQRALGPFGRRVRGAVTGLGN